MFPTLTTVRCDCCGGTFIDEVGLMVIEDAIRAYREELRAGRHRDDRAWSEARADVDAAVKEAMA